MADATLLKYLAFTDRLAKSELSRYVLKQQVNLCHHIIGRAGYTAQLKPQAKLQIETNCCLPNIRNGIGEILQFVQAQFGFCHQHSRLWWRGNVGVLAFWFMRYLERESFGSYIIARPGTGIRRTLDQTCAQSPVKRPTYSGPGQRLPNFFREGSRYSQSSCGAVTPCVREILFHYFESRHRLRRGV
jgi:hypothetical protein